jgi:hypothetical protein
LLTPLYTGELIFSVGLTLSMLAGRVIFMLKSKVITDKYNIYLIFRLQSFGWHEKVSVDLKQTQFSRKLPSIRKIFILYPIS